MCYMRDSGLMVLNSFDEVVLIETYGGGSHVE
jgi:hypothetical protein